MSDRIKRHDVLGRTVEKLVALPVTFLVVICDLLEKIAGPQRQEWFEALKLFLRKENPWSERESLNLVCNKIFCIHEDWRIWKGPANGDGLEGEEDRDPREDTLFVIDWGKVLFQTHLHGKEALIYGEEKLKRAKAGNDIRLGGRALISLWEDYKARGTDSILVNLHRTKGIRRIYFLGLVLRHQDGTRHVPYLYFDTARFEWTWGYCWLGGGWSVYDPSASLESS